MDQAGSEAEERYEPGLVVMLWQGYRSTARHLLRMLVPAAVLVIPLAVANTVARAFLPGRNAAIVNHDLQATRTVDGSPETMGLVVLVAALLLTGLALPVCLAAALAGTERMELPPMAARWSAGRWP